MTTRDMDRYAAMLGLTENQKEAARTLVEAYEDELAAEAEKARDEMRAIREDGGDDLWARMGEKMAQMRTKRQQMEATLLSDIKETLTPDQQAKWPVVERTRRREQTIGRGLLAGERLDLVRLVDGLKVDAETKATLEPVLEQYAVDLDRELVARNAAFDSAQANFRELLGGGDMAKMTEMFEASRAASTKVRDVNRRYARQIEPSLPEEARAAFSEQVKRDSYPMIYRQSYAARVVDAAGKMDSLTAEQKQSVKDLQERYAREMAALNQRMETEWDKREASIKPEDIVGRFGGGGGGGGGRGRGGPGGGGGGGGMFGGLFDSPEISDIRDQRRELEDTTVEKVRAVLTEEQRARLPERERGFRGGGEGGGGGRRGGGDGAMRNEWGTDGRQPAQAGAARPAGQGNERQGRQQRPGRNRPARPEPTTTQS